MEDPIITVILAIAGCSAFWQIIDHFLEYRRKQKFNIEEEVKSIKTNLEIMQRNQLVMQDSLNNLSSSSAENEAISKRVRILAFADDMVTDKQHSKDAFDQALSDIDGYEAYCAEHPHFKNNQTAISCAMIRDQYRECMEHHTFLQWSAKK